MPSDLVVSELNLGDVIEQPSGPPEPIRYEDTVVVPPQDLNDDIITLSIRDDELPDAVLKAVLLGLAEEQMALRSLRQKKEKDGKDIDHISIKRGTLLKYMSETLIQRQALVGGGGEIDLKGPKFREIFKMFLNTISDTFDEVKIPSEYKDLFFQSLARNLDGWEMRAEKIVRTIR
jgi:hypothetical protein